MSDDICSLRLALIGSWTTLLADLLGQPSSKRARQWRWNSRGSLSAVVSGPKAGTWFDHEASTGGGPFELIMRQRGGDWRAAADWARHWLGWPTWQARNGGSSSVRIITGPDVMPPVTTPANDLGPDPEVERRRNAQRTAQATWDRAGTVDPDHAYLVRKGVPPVGVRMDAVRHLIVPLVDPDGTIHTLQRICEAGDKRYLAGGAKAGHFTPIGDLPDDVATILVCEGWATGASSHAATGLPVVAAMDAGNLRLVAPLLRQRFPSARIVLLADNDDKPGRIENPGVAAATAAARSVDGLIAIPPVPGDFNDLAVASGLAAVRAVIDAAAPPAPQIGTYPRPCLETAAARLVLDAMVGRFMTRVAAYWNADPLADVPAFATAVNDTAPPRHPFTGLGNGTGQICAPPDWRNDLPGTWELTDFPVANSEMLSRAC